MILAIDVGNTNIAIGVVNRDRELVCHWRLASRTQRTSDEVLIHLRELFDLESVDRTRVSVAVISSVVPDLTHVVEQAVWRLLERKPIIVSTDLNLPVRMLTDTPTEIGSDLLANAVAGYTLAEGAAIVVDFGTALTFTAVDGEGGVRGVAIAPGLSTAVNGLVARTAALPMVDLSAPEHYIGTNTTASLCSGIVNGFAGLVDSMVTGIAAEMEPQKPMALATGGEAALVTGSCRSVIRLEPWLTLRGLYEIGIRNAGG